MTHSLSLLTLKKPGPVACALIFIALFASLSFAQDDAKKPAAPPAPPAQAPEGFRFGAYDGRADVELGYRWVSDIAGNPQVYRSMVNLGQGPKLLNSNISLRSNYGAGTLFDRLDLSVNNWGGDPYNSFRLNIARSDAYELRINYSNLNYYNFLPVYYNSFRPLSASPIASPTPVGQHSLNFTNRLTDVQLKLFPSRHVRPFLGYSRSTGFGPGFSTLGLSGSEFLLQTQNHFGADEFRGGVELSLPRSSVTIEQGFRFLKNDSGASQSGAILGSADRPFLGQTISLSYLGRGYHDRSTTPIFKLIAKSEPLRQLKFSGRYIYASAETDSAGAEIRRGSLASLEDLLAYSAAADSYNTKARRPSHSGAFAIEFSPFSRLSFVNQFDARSYDISASGLLSSSLFNVKPLAGGPSPYNATSSFSQDASLSYFSIRNQFDVEVDFSHGLFIRGGQRYAYTETSLRDTEDSSYADISTRSALFGFAFRPGRWLNLSLDFENNSSEGILTRTDLLDYNELRFSWRLSPLKSLSLSGRAALLHNENSQSDIDFRSRNRNYAFAVNYDPSERLHFNVDYERSFFLSALSILLPHNFSSSRSFYDERGSSFGGSLAVDFYRGLRTDIGYRVSLSAGDFPLNFYQPFASLTIPMGRRLAFKSHWQYFGYNEKPGSYQDFRTHLLSLGLAISY